MPELNISRTTTPNKVSDYSISSISPDSAGAQEETYWNNPNFTKYFGIYKSTAKIKNTLNTYATWCLGKGFDVDNRTRVILENIIGWGEDTFNSIIWNMLVMKKVNGDSYAQIIRNENGTLINLKPLNPQFMRHVCNDKGKIIRYDYQAGQGKYIPFEPDEILHFCNDRVADEIHGVSVIEAVQWNIEATEEAKRCHRKMVKNNGVVRVIEVDIDDTTKLNLFKIQWKDAIDKGDVLILPKDTAKAMDWHGTLDTAGVLEWLRYLDDDFYTSVGVPRVIMGGANDSTEAAAKVGSVMFDPIYIREITEMQADLWNQLAMRIEWFKQNSMMDNIQSDQGKNQSQTGFQPNDMMTGVGK